MSEVGTLTGLHASPIALKPLHSFVTLYTIAELQQALVKEKMQKRYQFLEKATSFHIC